MAVQICTLLCDQLHESILYVSISVSPTAVTYCLYTIFLLR